MTQELDIKEIVHRGEAIYGERIRPLVERDNFGKFLSIDIETGEWKMSDDLFTTTDLLHLKHPGALLFSTRVGYPGLVKMGFGRRPRVSA